MKQFRSASVPKFRSGRIMYQPGDARNSPAQKSTERGSGDHKRGCIEISQLDAIHHDIFVLATTLVRPRRTNCSEGGRDVDSRRERQKIEEAQATAQLADETALIKRGSVQRCRRTRRYAPDSPHDGEVTVMLERGLGRSCKPGRLAFLISIGGALSAAGTSWRFSYLSISAGHGAFGGGEARGLSYRGAGIAPALYGGTVSREIVPQTRFDMTSPNGHSMPVPFPANRCARDVRLVKARRRQHLYLRPR